jgi:hypothetical protein
MGFLSVIRRWALRDKMPIREIARRTDLARATIIVARFKAGDRRNTDQAHLFIPETSSTERDVIVGSAPSYEDTKAFLEAGWGEMENLSIEFWGGAQGVH